MQHSLRSVQSTVRACRVRSQWSLRGSQQRPLVITNTLLSPVAPAQPKRANHISSRTSIEPTIYALSTAPGRAAIAIIRISGPACLDIYHACCPHQPTPKARVATLRVLYQPHINACRDTILDSGALVLFFPAPRTVTGDDVLELHVHGGPAVVRSVLAAVSNSVSHVRYAEPGEFTQRAFFNGRLDLIQVEALGDVLAAETEQQARLALRGTTSKLAVQYNNWKIALLHARGELEALIDFSEDQHLDEEPQDLLSSVSRQIISLRQRIAIKHANAVRGELLRNGIKIALLGKPNVGKSSLLNCIVGRNAAIVSPNAGTTRDIVEVGIDLGGWLCRFGDTAGLRTAAIPDGNAGHSTERIGDVELEGMKRARAFSLDADVILMVCAIEHHEDRGPFLRIDPEVQETVRKCRHSGRQVIAIVNKIDRLPAVNLEADILSIQDEVLKEVGIPAEKVHFISCAQAGQSSVSNDPGNIGTLVKAITTILHSITEPLGDKYDTEIDTSLCYESLGATERHRRLLETCLEHLDEYLVTARVNRSAYSGVSSNEVDVVLAAESLRGAATCLSKITGGMGGGDVENVLGVVFEKFCVGK